MNYHDAYGLPAVVTRMFNNYGPRQNPRYVTGTIITQALERPRIELGQLDPLRDFCFCTDGVRGHLTVAAQGTPGDVYVYGQGENISMADWAAMILRVGEEGGYWPAGREIVTTAARFRPGASEVMALRVGYDKLEAETGWTPKISWEEGVRRTIAWYAANRESWVGRVDWMTGRKRVKALVTGGAGFLGSFLVERLRERGDEVVVPRRAEYDLTRWDDAERLFETAQPEIVFHLAAEVGGIGANRANPGRYWFANLMMGAQHARALPAARRLEAASSPARSARTRSSRRRRSPRTTSGTATRRRRTRPTASRRSRSWSAGRPTASSTASTPSTCSRRTSTGRGTTSTSRPRTSSRR